MDGAGLAVHEAWRAHHLAAEDVTDALLSRQTPSKGMRGPNKRITSLLMPLSSCGVPAPG